MEARKIENMEEFFTVPVKNNLKKVCIFGQGFVGLPLTLSFSLRGCEATGVDINEINDGPLVIGAKNVINEIETRKYGVKWWRI